MRKITYTWEQRKLGQISTTYSGGTPKVGRNDYYDGDIPFIRSGEIHQSTTELTLTEKGLNESSASMVSKGTLLYALYGATSGEVAISKQNGAINQAILAIIPNKNYDNEFLCQILEKKKNEIVDTFLQGGQGNLSAAIIKNLHLSLPDFKEQSAIGVFFHNIDNLITLHQRLGKNMTM